MGWNLPNNIENETSTKRNWKPKEPQSSTGQKIKSGNKIESIDLQGQLRLAFYSFKTINFGKEKCNHMNIMKISNCIKTLNWIQNMTV